MMRACVGIQAREDFWFNQGVEEEENEQRKQRAIQSQLIKKSLMRGISKMKK